MFCDQVKNSGQLGEGDIPLKVGQFYVGFVLVARREDSTTSLTRTGALRVPGNDLDPLTGTFRKPNPNWKNQLQRSLGLGKRMAEELMEEDYNASEGGKVISA